MVDVVVVVGSVVVVNFVVFLPIGKGAGVGTTSGSSDTARIEKKEGATRANKLIPSINKCHLSYEENNSQKSVQRK